MADTILSSPFVTETLLPFLLVFTVLFAILQKSQILGKDKKQIDAIVSLVVGLIVVSVGQASAIITGLMPVLAVALVVLLVFMILVGSVWEGKVNFGTGIKVTVGILAVITIVVALLYNTGFWVNLRDLFSGLGPNVVTNIVFIIAIIAAVAVVIGFSGKGGAGGEAS